MIETEGLDHETSALVTQLHQAWRSNAPISTFAHIRDELLAQRGRVETRIAVLGMVAKIACKAALDREELIDAGWSECFALLADLEPQEDLDLGNAMLGKRKRTHDYNQGSHVRNLAIIAALWSPEVVNHYGWNLSGQRQVHLMRTCATQYPRFREDFCHRLNPILLRRHCTAIKHCRGQALNEVPLQPHKDFSPSQLRVSNSNGELEKQWTTNEDGAVPLDAEGTLLKDLRPCHFKLYLLEIDQYGMLAPRREKQMVVVEPASPPLASNMDITFSRELSLRGLSGSNTPNSEHFQLQDPLFSQLHGFSTISPFLLQKQLGHTDLPSASPVLHPPSSESESSSDSSPEDCTAFDLNEQCQDEQEVAPEADSEGNDAGNSSEQEQSSEVDTDSICEDEAIPSQASHPRRPQRNESRDTVENAQTLPESSHGHCTIEKPSSVSQASDQHHKGRSRSELEVCTPPSPKNSRQSLEGKLHSKYHARLVTYVKSISKEALHKSERDRRPVRAAWLSLNTKWAKVWTPHNDGMPRGTALCEDNAEILYYSCDNFMTDAQGGKIFSKPVVIKEKFADAGMHTVNGFIALMLDIFHDKTLDVETLDDKETRSMSVQDFARATQSQGKQGKGLNSLNLRNITKSYKPRLTMLRRFRLLESLLERLHADVGEKTDPKLVGLSSLVGFNCVGLSGAFSRPQVNAFGGTWVRNLHGLALWTIVPEKEMRKEWESFAELGEYWLPDGKERLVLLEEDDVLFIPPGLRVVYAVHSPARCLMEIGTLWDDLNICKTLDVAQWVWKTQDNIDRPLTNQLLRILVELEALVKIEPCRFCGGSDEDDFMRYLTTTVNKLRDMQTM